ncbi:uncharacterized protein ACA1_265280 [Acanthamoeba castellanii str. Neff]|uniref:Uncharacterized protein n=1 Tax=Acanthamoeba castellanii (strain ATCC 30010 / Neff) TaxID=1257118 RepID=L8H1E0_ACACF|nr:uncharacterized protein ACA1_265280 [Acanthamoeba castellanii str. Neff]ELR19324.1 hypothetical protein ACA1_265280 [Acanthamoeba castellanii str. Neff]
MQHITELVQQHLPGIYVVALEVTGSKIGSIFTGSDKQVEMICAALAADSKLAGGINAMGVSQGGILLRGYLERCNNPPVKNFISWVAPMMGVYGVPEVGHWEYLNVTLDEIADCCVYQDWAQSLLSFAGYWRDPFALDKYVDRNIFLADINNEGSNKNPTYKKNVLALDNFVMSYSTADTVLIPLETGWFGAYANGTDSQVVPLEKQPFYEFDYIGLRTLDQAGKLHRFTTDCIHEDYTSPCFDKYFLANVLPFLAS